MSAMIHLENVSKRYDMERAAVHALREVSIEIGPGEYVALLGPSGSGKSTLLHVIGCLDRPTSGRYLLEGEDVGALDVNRLADLRNRKMGFVFQAFHLLPRLSALENVALPLRLGGVGTAERTERARELLERMGLARHEPSRRDG